MNKPKCKTYADGTKIWLLNGERHREDGPACEWAFGTTEWYIKGKHHREDGPAVESQDGTRGWFLHGERHREDGPALEYASGHKQWHLNGEEVDPEIIVDLWLARGVFCYYDEQDQELKFQ
jgi:hypothetical protein